MSFLARVNLARHSDDAPIDIFQGHELLTATVSFNSWRQIGEIVVDLMNALEMVGARQ